MSLRYNKATVFFSFLRFTLLKRYCKKIIIGAGGQGIKGYLKTEMNYLDVELPLGLNNLDEIISEHVWEHLEHPIQATINCYNALAKGGKLIISVPHPSAETPEEYIKWGHKSTFTNETLKELFSFVGFREVKVINKSKYNIFYRDTPSIIVEGVK